MTQAKIQEWNILCKKINTMTKKVFKEWLEAQNIEFLNEIYINAKDVYYNKTIDDERDIIKDNLYDEMESFLENKANGADTTTIGIEPPKHQKNRETLPYFMPSMNKIKTSFKDVDKRIEKWLSKYNNPDEYIYSQKLDGVSGMYVFDRNLPKEKQHRLYTRGNGKLGTNISHFIDEKNMYYLYLLKCFLNEQTKYDKVVLRGEFIIPEYKFNHDEHGSNSRNFVAGIINSKTINIKHSNLVDFIIYEVIEPVCEIENKFSEMLFIRNFLSEFYYYIHNQKTYKSKKISSKTNSSDYELLGKNINVKCVFGNLIMREKINKNDLLYTLEYVKKHSIYECDGIIISHNKYYKRTDEYKNPEHSFAFKHDDEDMFKWTKVEDVIWNVSKHGLLKPTIKIQRVVINNINIDYTTGFNASFIENNKINKNTRVCIKRSGDVIPVIVKVEHNNEVLPLMPNVDYKWNETHVDILIDVKDAQNNYYQQYLTKKIHYFTKTMGIKHIGESIIEKCVQNGIVSPQQLCTTTEKRWMEIDTIQEKNATKFVEQIKRAFTSNKLSLGVFMDASCCFGSSIGPKKLKKITSNAMCCDEINKYLNIKTSTKTNKNANSSIQELFKLLPKIETIGDKNTEEFIDGLMEFKCFYNDFLNTEFGEHIQKITITQKKTQQQNENCKNTMNIVFTGFRNKDLEASLEECGYSMGTTVSKNTKCIVVKNEEAKNGSSAKIKKALQLNIPIYHQEECLKYIV
jgi:NAD-dependent DNA ligase